MKHFMDPGNVKLAGYVGFLVGSVIEAGRNYCMKSDDSEKVRRKVEDADDRLRFRHHSQSKWV